MLRSHVWAFYSTHLISEQLPAGNNQQQISNSDPITGQAAWYDLRVRGLVRISRSSKAGSEPKFKPGGLLPGMKKMRQKWLTYRAGKK